MLQFVTDGAQKLRGIGRNGETRMTDDDEDDVAFVEDAITEEDAKESQIDLMEAMNG